MTAIDNQPNNINLLQQTGFRFIIQRLPHMNYFCQEAPLPGVSLARAQTSTPLSIIPRPGSKLTWQPLTLKFKVDEDLNNIIEIFNWMIGLGHPESLEQTKEFSASSPVPNVKPGTAASFVSDATLVVLTSKNNANRNVTFYDVFPTDFGGITFRSDVDDVQYLEAEVTFQYRMYKFV